MVKRSIEQDLRILGPETVILKETLWSRIRGQNSVDQEFSEIVGNVKPTGSVRKETLAEACKSWHSRIRLRVLSCSRMREMCREPEVPEARVSVVECLDGPARITSKELAPVHSVKNCILQNACSTSPRVGAEVVNSSRMRIARLTNSLAKGLKRMVTKVQWLCWRRMSSLAEQGDLFWTLIIKYTTLGLRIPGFGAAEVFIDFTEELRHAETDPMCKIHESCCTSRRHSRPKSFARTCLPKWTSSA